MFSQTINSLTDEMIVGNPLNISGVQVAGVSFEELKKALKPCKKLGEFRLKNLKGKLSLKELIACFPRTFRIYLDNVILEDEDDFIEENKVVLFSLINSDCKKLPKQFYQFSDLLDLELSNLPLTEFSSELCTFHSLRTLTFCIPYLDEVPSIFLTQENISTLKIELSEKVIYDSTHFNFERMSFLNIKVPTLESLPFQLHELRLVRYLTVHLTQQKEFVDVELPSLSLENFKIEAPQLQKFSIDFSRYEKLKSMDLKADKLDYFPGELLKSPTLRIISFESNNIKTLDINKYNFDIRTLKLKSESIEEIKPLFSVQNKVKYLGLDIPNLKEFPFADDEAYETLNLTLESEKIDSVPHYLSNFKELKYLELKLPNLNELPDVFDQLRKLKTLKLSTPHLKAIPSTFAGSLIGNITIEANCFEDVPEELLKMKYLNQVYLSSDSLKTLDNYSKFVSKPYFKIKSAPNISPYDIRIVKKFRLNGLENIFDYKFDAIEDYILGLQKAGFERELYCYFFDLVACRKDLSTLPELTKKQLIQGLNIKFERLQEVLLERLDNTISDLTSESCFMVMGGITLKKTELKERVEQLGFQYANKYSDKVTHIIIGNNPKEIAKVDEIDNEIKLISESTFTDYWNTQEPGFLIEDEKEGDGQMVENLKLFFKSQSEGDLMIAMEMLEMNGVPKSVLPDLFLIQKTNKNTKIKARVKKLLTANASKDLIQAVKDRAGLNNYAKLHEYHIREKLVSFEEKWGKEACFTFSNMLYKYYKKGLTYTLLYAPVHSKWRQEAVGMIYNKGEINWAEALGNNNYRYYRDNKTGYPKLPVEILKTEKVEKLDITKIEYGEFPEELKQFKDLKSLSISGISIRSISDEIKLLEKLEELDISRNYLISDIQQVASLKKLKKLTLQWMSIAELGEEFTSLQNLEELNLYRNKLERFPNELYQLKKLKKVNLEEQEIYTEEGRVMNEIIIPEEFKEKMPDCEVKV
ncbi:BRCT domain-containing protein [Flammeovirga aprica]|uniref:BRCT domain-containing protein n=1 Tax=Flammeovirga aprica JL-4 TaxID=694437 RepID=A0A7X9RZR1_9BACT|nr:BRCT domain-containing protein [Flammeovirga aprica]NME71716.1 hypothetical protein [Flammeovirga aprica JL-4]